MLRSAHCNSLDAVTVPIIAVFTKFDCLVNSKIPELRKLYPKSADARHKAEEAAQHVFEASCVDVLKHTAGAGKVPHARVSSKICSRYRTFLF